MAEKKEKLFDMFPGISYEEWRAKVEADLKGADFEKKLVWRTNEGFNVQPVYRAEDTADLKTTDSLPGEFPYVRGTRRDNEWLHRQEIIADSAEEANKIALDVLNKGINSLGFKVGDAAEIPVLLKDITLSAVEINITCCMSKVMEVAKALVAYIREQGAEETFTGSIDFNPLRKALRKGASFDASAASAQAVEMLDIAAPVKGLRCLAVDSVMLGNAGAFIYQELGYALGWGAAWMTALTEAGRSADEVARRIKFNMCISSNFFMEIAKFRAARMMWAQIVAQYKGDKESAKMHTHAATSRFNQTIYDAHVNLLRSQTEAFSAAVAGVDSMTVTPFDVPYQRPDAFSERIARNQQFLLKEESHLDKVVDPAGGSYYVETLTVSIAREAWKLFLEVDEKGGFFACVADGSVQDAVNASCIKRHQDVARRKEVLLGTNQYPNINEKAADKIKTGGCCSCCCGSEEKGEHALIAKRAATDFEDLRLATEASARRPKVFMLTIGNLAMRLARAQFSTNFFGCAGYEIVDNLGFDTVEDGINAALAQNADVIVLCSSDDEYATLAPEAFRFLDGRAEFVVAGAPACMEDLQKEGITNFVHVRCNVLDTLRAFNAKLLK